MKMKKLTISVIFLLFSMLFVMSGCGYKNEVDDNIAPVIQLYNNPADGDTVGAAPIMYWQAFDKDGKVYIYEYIDLPFEQVGKGLEANSWNAYNDDRQSLADIDSIITLDGLKLRWVETESSSTSDTIFLQLLDPDSVTKHLFCVRGRDNEAMYSDVACMVLYRTNTPPDSCAIVTDSLDGGEFWILANAIYGWAGIEVSWVASDPDNSIILEYKWWIEDADEPHNVILTSLLDDTLGGVNSGYDSEDGWIRNTTTHIVGEIPASGDYWFIVQARDDAFYPGAADTATITLAQPVFDISDPTVYQQYIDGTFPHKVLIIDQNDNFLYPNYMTVQAFYEGVFDDLKTSDAILDFEIHRPPSASSWDIPRTQLADFSIVWVLDQEYFGSYYKINEVFLEELMLYIQVGGRLVFDGRDMFTSEREDWTQLPSRDYFGIKNIASGSGSKIFETAIANPNIADYPDLEIDPTKTFSGDSAILAVTRLGVSEPSYSGSPYTQRLYSFGINDIATPQDSVDYANSPVAVRFVTPSFRSAYFGFPLYLMKNDAGQVDQVIESTIEFIKTQIDVVVDTTDYF